MFDRAAALLGESGRERRMSHEYSGVQ